MNAWPSSTAVSSKWTCARVCAQLPVFRSCNAVSAIDRAVAKSPVSADMNPTVEANHQSSSGNAGRHQVQQIHILLPPLPVAGKREQAETGPAAATARWRPVASFRYELFARLRASDSKAERRRQDIDRRLLASRRRMRQLLGSRHMLLRRGRKPMDEQLAREQGVRQRKVGVALSSPRVSGSIPGWSRLKAQSMPCRNASRASHRSTALRFRDRSNRPSG